MPQLSTQASSIGLSQLADLTRNPWGSGSFIAQTVNRALCSATYSGASGRLEVFGGIVIPAGRTVTSVSFCAVGSATTPTNQWFALFDTAANRLAITADDTTTAWNANAVKTLTLAVPYTPSTDMQVYAGICVVASGLPTLAATANTGTGLAAITPVTAASANSSLTNPASCPSPFVPAATRAMTAWAAVS